MPYISVWTSQKIDCKQKEQFFSSFGKIISVFFGKSEKWLMVNLHDEQNMCFSGHTGETALVEVKLFAREEGKNEVYNEFSQKATDLVCETLKLPPDRVYVAYFETPHWGWNGKNF